MNEHRIGQFIAELRKEKNMTQKDLAGQLHITDKAISKWERGLSCPDISLLSPLADLLGVTVSELLNAKKNETPPQDVMESVDHALAYAEKSSKRSIASFRHILTISFSAILLLGILVCVICDVAISGALTWSWYPVSSILFAWLVCVPALDCFFVVYLFHFQEIRVEKAIGSGSYFLISNTAAPYQNGINVRLQ